MRLVQCFILISIIQLPLKSYCVENNVCKTIQDYSNTKNNPNCEYDVAADPRSNPITIIEFYGYPSETHKVITLDGYILTMFRIPNQQEFSKRGPVFLQHGWMSSAATFLGLRKNSLAFVLADAGYDVWLGNYRGTEYSEGHVNLTVNDRQYWDHGFDEIGLYDIPAQLNYISQATGDRGNIVYIAHSLGTSLGLIYSSVFVKQAKRTLKLLILLAPVAEQSNTKASLFRIPNVIYKTLLNILLNNNLLRLVSQANILKSLNRQFCILSPLHIQFCQNGFNIMLAGPQSQMEPRYNTLYDYKLKPCIMYNRSRKVQRVGPTVQAFLQKTVPVFFNQILAGSSFKVLNQIVDGVAGSFKQYDYGLKNLEKYGSYEPPSYELKNIEVPVFIAYAISDWAITPKDALNAYSSLAPKARYGKYEIKIPNFNHFDYLYGINARSVIYNVILQVLDGME